ncbi:MAG TPA: hypothetical protein VMI06_15240 [Terriglobia bacterium]|nr:hypothetical protein [Terriglobia bacterium]
MGKPSSYAGKKKKQKKKENSGILGVVPSLGVVNAPEAPPMTSEQKLHLAETEFANPFIVLEDAGKAEYYRATSPAAKIGYGGEGYAKQLGAAYLDTISGSMFSSFVYPTLLHQDPRYYRDGKGSIPGRIGYAIAHVFVSRSDAGQKEFNWSQVLGSTTETFLSSTYYPARGRTAGRISSNIGWAILGDAGTNTFNEFWPDFSRWLSGKMRRIRK